MEASDQFVSHYAYCLDLGSNALSVANTEIPRQHCAQMLPLFHPDFPFSAKKKRGTEYGFISQLLNTLAVILATW